MSNLNLPKYFTNLLASGGLKARYDARAHYDFATVANAMEDSFAEAPFPLDPRSAGRPRKGEVVEETETLTVRLPKSIVRQIVAKADELGISRNRFFKIAAIRMIQDPIIESGLPTLVEEGRFQFIKEFFNLKMHAPTTNQYMVHGQARSFPTNVISEEVGEDLGATA